VLNRNISIYKDRIKETIARMKKVSIIVLISFAWLFLQAGSSLHAREIVYLTLESAVDIAMENSYRIKMLEMSVKRNYSRLKSEIR